MTDHTLVTRYAPLAAISRQYDRRLETWLTANELNELEKISNPLRRRQWMSGRWISKKLVDASAASRSIEILSRSATGLGSRPRVYVDGDDAELSLSISHTQKAVFVGLARGEGCSVGVDLACSVPTDPRFRQAWFTDAEQRWLADKPQDRTRVLWALKEAFFKAGNSGQPWTPQQVEIVQVATGLQGCLFGQQIIPDQVWMQTVDDQLAATVYLADSASPVSKLTRPSEWISCL